MIHIIYPSDSTTEFLLEIHNEIIEKTGVECINLIRIEASEEAYLEGISLIKKISHNSIILFMGHGQNDLLFGGESLEFPKKPLIRKSDIRIFERKYIFSLSCYSNELFRSTFNFSNINNSIGFGSLPTEMTEVDNNKRLKELGINDSIVKRYKEILVEIVSLSFIRLVIRGISFFELSNYFSLLLNKKISEIILNDKTSCDSRILADLLFQMRSEMVFI